MATFRLRRFSDPNVLREIRPDRLQELLGRYADYFNGRGVILAAAPDDALDYEGIAGVLMQPDETTPNDLVDDLYFVDEMATTEGMDALQDEIAALQTEQRAKIDCDPDATPADFAVAVRLHAPEALERRHAESSVTSKRSFFYFLPSKRAEKPFEPPSRSEIRELERALADALLEMKRGGHAKVFVFEKREAVWILVRRGDPCKREASLSAAGSGSVYFRPEVFDIVRYDAKTDELSMSAGGSRRIYDLLREKIGLHLFGDAGHFAADAVIFTLDPLRVAGEEALTCVDIEGLESIVLREIKIAWGGAEHEVETRRANDLFRAYERRHARIPDTARIVQAKFQVTFSDSKTPRMVTITNSNKTTYTRDSDAAVIEEWMVKRGFTLEPADVDG